MQRTYFLSSMLLICLSYAVFEYFLIPTWVLSADEFVFARHIYEYTFHFPYLDFSPYKTILGYYLLSLPFYFSHELLQPLFYIKDEIALLNVAALALSAWWATRFFDKRAILWTLLAIIANQFFLTYASDLRVDMLTSWLCLFCALAVLDKRIKLGGVLLGIAFLVSQKALWTLFAINGAMILCLLALRESRFSWRALCLFNLTFMLPILAYILLWSWIASPNIVLYNLFYEAYIQAKIDWYLSIYFNCWQIILSRGPLLFLLWPLTYMSISFTQHARIKDAEQGIFIASFATFALLLFIDYKQPFPYNFVFTIPAFFLLYNHFLSWLLAKKSAAIRSSTLFIFSLLFYTLIIASLVYYFSLSFIYYSLAVAPLLLFFSLTTRSLRMSYFLALITLTGIIYPLYQSTKAATKLNGYYQQSVLQLASQLLAHEGSYLAGIPYLYQKDQAIAGMMNLIGPAIEYLDAPSPKLNLLLLPSLYLAPTSTEKVIHDLETSDVKIIISNYRIISLPLPLQIYIAQQYQHFYASIYLYAPVITPEQLSFYLKFSAKYRITSYAKTIIIDGHHYHPEQVISLKKGDHLSDAKSDYRLVLLSDVNLSQLNKKYQDDRWLSMIKAILN